MQNKQAIPVARHGDLTIWKVSDNSQFKMKLRKDNILAFGEVTGHKHQIAVKERVVWDGENQTLEINGEKLQVSKAFTLTMPAEITHEEHKNVFLPAGDYIVTTERERNPFLQAIQQVKD